MLTAVLVLAAMAGTPAQAQSRFEVHERSLRLSLRIEASNGYDGWVETEGHRRVTLSLRKGETTIEARTRGRVSRHGIDAEFGDLGRISVRFRGRRLDFGPRGDGDRKRRCRGRGPVFESGLFSGTIQFRGENGFTQVDTKQARGFATRHYRQVCKTDPKDEASLGELFESLIRLMPVTALRARDRVDGATLLFEAAAVDLRPIFGGGFLVYVHSARAIERSDGMRLTRTVSAEGGRRSFRFRRGRRAPRAATVQAPKPLTGSATYVKDPGAPAVWTGSLAAHLPGIGPVAMAGPGFKAAICNLTLGALVDGRCLPGSRRVSSRALSLLDRRLAQGSGSQSQAFWDARLPWSR